MQTYCITVAFVLNCITHSILFMLERIAFQEFVGSETTILSVLHLCPAPYALVQSRTCVCPTKFHCFMHLAAKRIHND